MKRNIHLLLLTIFCSIFTCTYSKSNEPVDKKTEAYLKNFRSDYIKSMLDKNADRLESYYSENLRLMPEFQKTILGKSNVVLYHKAFSNRFDIKSYNREEIEILDLGLQVVEIGKLSLEILLKSSQKEHVLAGVYMNIWEKRENGSLALITEAWNYDQYYNGINEHLRFEEVPAIHVALLPNVYVNSSISFELAALNKLLDATVTQHDANLWSQFYADDAMLIPNYHPICNGRKAINEYIEKHVIELPIFEGLDIRNDHIDDLGKYVVEYASHVASWKNGESSGVGLGKNIRIWRREPDHSLKLFRSMGMYD